MIHLTRILSLLCVCLWSTGCIVDREVSIDIEDPDAPIPVEHPCDIENPQCGEGLMCAAVVLCESACPEGADGEGFACPEVCVENYACVEKLEMHDPCQPHLDRCGDHLACQVDEAAGCQPSFCDGEFCTTDCMAVFSCQPTDPPTRCEDVECGEGFECTIEVRPQRPEIVHRHRLLVP